ncbi:MAG: hypothetical protein WCE88_07045, partial [Burkholderiales bacterium]
YKESRRSTLPGGTEPRINTLPDDWSISPNFSDWTPGDVVLSQGDGTMKGEVIVIAIKAGAFWLNRCPEQDDRKWIHVAIYAGDGLLIEATKKGVVITPVCQQVIESAICMRRCKKVQDATEGMQLVEVAMTLVGTPYMQLVKLVSVYLAGVEKKEISGIDLGDDAFTCSTFVQHVFLKALGVVLNKKFVACMPCEFVNHENLKPITIGWRLAA